MWKQALLVILALALLLTGSTCASRGSDPAIKLTESPISTLELTETSEPTETAEPTETPLPSPTPTSEPTPTPEPLFVPTGFEAQNVEFVSHIGGTTSAVAAKGQHAYIGVGSRMVILDVSNPTSPNPVGETSPLPDVVHSLAIAEDTAYIAAGQAGLWAVDISDPTKPMIMGSYDTPGEAWDVELAGERAVVTDRGGGLRVVDISNAAELAEIGAVEGLGANAVTVGGERAYVVAGQEGLGVVDITSPGNPVEIGTFNPQPRIGIVNDVAVEGPYAYLADGDEGLTILDISDPVRPTRLGNHTPLRSSTDVTVGNGHAYIADVGGTVSVFDVSDPTSPEAVGMYESEEVVSDLSISSGYLYLACGYGGLRVLDVSTPSRPM